MANKTLSEIKAQLEKLQAEYDAVLSAEKDAKLTEVQEICAAYGFTSEDVFPVKKKRNLNPDATRKTYRNPQTGEEYRSRGKPPASFAAVGKEVWQTWEVK